jgi:hypothetical protein
MVEMQRGRLSPFHRKFDALQTVVVLTPENKSSRSTPSPQPTMFGSKASFYDTERNEPSQLDVQVVSVARLPVSLKGNMQTSRPLLIELP